ncbi:MAG: hypothetical protein K2Y37_02190 [Pirellulales bacterium]|nr:hypothetical protein [Pirellulales bacterium]
MAPTLSSSTPITRPRAARAAEGSAFALSTGPPMPAWADLLRAGSIRWRLADGWPARLGIADDEFGRWLTAQHAVVVKASTHRQVFRIDSRAGAIYVKRYRARRGLARWATLLRGTPARRELETGHELIRRRIPTAAPIAVGEVVRVGIPGDSLLVTCGIERSQPLSEFLAAPLPAWPATAQHEARRWLACDLARLLAAAHRAGVRHNDLHAGNILVATDQLPRTTILRNRPGRGVSTSRGAYPSFLYLIDLPAVRCSRPLGTRASLASVVMLAAGLWSQTTPRERWRFWRTYLACRPDLAVENRRAIARQIESDVLSYLRALHRSRDRRSVADNRDFARFAVPGATWHALRAVSLDELTAAAAAAGIQRALPTQSGAPAAVAGFDSKTSTNPLICRTIAAGQWRWFPWREHPARRLWRLAQGLAARGIRIERPVAAFVPSRFSGQYDGALFFKPDTFVPIVGPLAGPDANRGCLAPHDSHQLARACGELLGTLDRWHVHCPQLSLASLAVERTGEGLVVVLRDWMTVRRASRVNRHLAERRAARDLTALYADWKRREAAPSATMSRTWLARALRAYVAARWQPPHAWRDLWRSLASAKSPDLPKECLG